jgi:hypothetical protein
VHGIFGPSPARNGPPPFHIESASMCA